MLIRYYCLGCGQRIKVDSSMIGTVAGCPTCGQRQEVPGPTQADVSEALHELRQSQQTGDFPSPPTRPDDQAVLIANKVKKVRTLRGSCYIFILLASLPLFLGIVFDDNTTVITRLEKTIQQLPRAEKQRANKVYGEYKRNDADIEEVLQVLPGHRIQGAWQPLYSKWHFYLTGIATVSYFLMLGALFPHGFSRFPLKLGVALFTGTVGMALLFTIQAIAMSGGVLVGGPFGFFFALIGIAYNVIDIPDISFGMLFLANTLGVGLCEEVVKALPVFVLMLGRHRMKWYECCTLGFASGLGFGIVEALDYGQRYHGLYDQLTYVIRFVSCVVSHGVSTAAAALLAHRFQGLVQGEMTWGDMGLRLLALVAIPMVLHGLYNTLCTREMDGLALAVDLLNFGWLAIMIETARDREGDAIVEVPLEPGGRTQQPVASKPVDHGWISGDAAHRLRR